MLQQKNNKQKINRSQSVSREPTNQSEDDTTSGYGDGIEIDVETLYVESESEPEQNKYVFAYTCLLYTSPSPRDATLSRMPSSA